MCHRATHWITRRKQNKKPLTSTALCMLSTEGGKSPLRKNSVCSCGQGSIHGSQHPHTPGQVTAAPTTYIGFSLCGGSWLSTLNSTSAGLLSCCSAVLLKDRKLLMCDGEVGRPIPFALRALSSLLLPQWRDYDSVADLVEMLRTGVTGMEAKKGRLKDEAGVKGWIVWKKGLEAVGLDRDLGGQGNGDKQEKHEWWWQVHVCSCVNIHKVWEEIFFITCPEVLFWDIKFCILHNSSAESDVNWCLLLQCCLYLILWLGLPCERWHIGFQRTKGLPGTPACSRCSYSFCKKKSVWKTQSTAEKGNGQEKLPPMPFPCPGLRQDLNTEAQNT